MDRIKLRKHSRDRRRRGLQRRIRGSAARPRLAVFRSSKHIYAQVVDDLTGRTIAAASTVEKGLDRAAGGNVSAASEVGATIVMSSWADKSEKLNISSNRLPSFTNLVFIFGLPLLIKLLFQIKDSHLRKFYLFRWR